MAYDKETIKAIYHDEVWMKIEASTDHLLQEISDHFTYIMPNYEILKKVNKKFWYWDGRIKLFKKRQKLLPYGLIRKLKLFCETSDYELIFDDRISNNHNYDVTEEAVRKFIDDLELPYEMRDYQFAACSKAIRNKRLVSVMPTGSGKSLAIYTVARWIQENDLMEGEKILIVVPNKGLLVQLKDNFAEYGYTGSLHCIQAGVDKNSAKDNIYISTWQSIYEEPEEYFLQFKAFMYDEIQQLRAVQGDTAVKTLAENCVNACYRFGFTGTLHDETIHKTVLEAYFGTLFQTITTHDLIERGQVAKFKVNSIILKYPADITQELSRLDFQQQKEFQESIDNPRQRLIIKLAESLEKNTVILFNRIEHGTFIYNELLNNKVRKNVYFIDGSISGEERNAIIAQLEKEIGSILVASYGTTSAGTNCKNLHNVIFSSSYKSKVRVLQSIGRSLRLHDDKDCATLIDIVDAFGYMDDHYSIRKSFYKREKFPFKEIEIQLDSWMKAGEKIDFLI
jgi:superfamily II DNA or RNA helicase